MKHTKLKRALVGLFAMGLALYGIPAPVSAASNSYIPNGTINIDGYIDDSWKMEFILAPDAQYGSKVELANQRVLATDKKNVTFKPVIFHEPGTYRLQLIQYEVYLPAKVCNCGAINFPEQHSTNHVLKGEMDNYWTTNLEVPGVEEDARIWFLDVTVSGTAAAPYVSNVQYWTIFDDMDKTGARFQVTGPAAKPDWPPKVDDIVEKDPVEEVPDIPVTEVDAAYVSDGMKTYKGTFADVWQRANEIGDGEIKLLKDASFTEPLVTDASISLDLQGHKLVYSGKSSPAVRIPRYSGLTIKDTANPFEAVTAAGSKNAWDAGKKILTYDGRRVNFSKSGQVMGDGAENVTLFSVSGGNLSIENGVFSNVATAAQFTSGTFSMTGGAIVNTNGTGLVLNSNDNVTVSDAYFVGNITGSRAGAILNDPNTGNGLGMNNMVFAFNESVGNGGALFSNGVCRIQNCTFVSNKSNGKGGAVYNEGNLSVGNGCKFLENTATFGAGIWAMNGDTFLSGQLSMSGNSGSDIGLQDANYLTVQGLQCTGPISISRSPVNDSVLFARGTASDGAFVSSDSSYDIEYRDGGFYFKVKPVETPDNPGGNTGGDNKPDNPDNPGDNTGGNTGDNTGDNKPDNPDNPGDNTGGNTGDNKPDNPDNPGDNTGDNKPDNPDNTGGNTGGNTGDNTGDNKPDNPDNPGDNTGGNTGDNTGDNKPDNPDNPGDNTGDNKPDNPDNTGGNTSGNTGDNTGDNKPDNPDNPGDNTGDNKPDNPDNTGGNTGDNTGDNKPDNPDNPGDNTGGNTGDNTGGDNKPDNPDNPGGNTGGNTGDNTGDNKPDNPDNPGGNTGDNKPDNPDNTGGNTGDNTGDNKPDNPDNPGDNTGGNTGDNTGGNKPDNPDNPGGNTGGNTGDNPGGNTGDNKPDNPDNPGGNKPDNPGQMEKTGALTVSNNVKGQASEKQFQFTLKLTGTDGKPLAGEFPLTLVKADGSVEKAGLVTGGMGTFTLADSEHIQISGLPDKCGYTVTEDEYGCSTSIVMDGAKSENRKASGSIEAGKTSFVSYINAYGYAVMPETGSNSLQQTMAGGIMLLSFGGMMGLLWYERKRK